MKTASTKFFFLILFLWILFAFFSVLYNSTKAISEIIIWGSLSDDEKRHKIFGNLHDFFIFINTHTESDSDILIYSHDVKTHYLGIYYLYPRRIITIDNNKDLLAFEKTGKFHYIAVYNDTIEFTHYEKIY